MVISTSGAARRQIHHRTCFTLRSAVEVVGARSGVRWESIAVIRLSSAIGSKRWHFPRTLANRTCSPQVMVMSAPSFSLVPHRAVIAVGGPDRVDFLQGLISNDTTKVGPDRAIWAALLTPQGRFLNDMFVADGGGDTRLRETEHERTRALAKKLGLYKLRSKVTVEDRSTVMEVAVVFGPGAEKVPPIAGATAFVDPRLPERGPRVLAPAGQAASLLGALGCTDAPLAAYDA